jgi:hypothetical protein
MTDTETEVKDTKRRCDHCHKVLDSTDKRRRYCNEECRMKSQQQQLAELTKRRRQVKCPNCKQVIVLVPEEKRRGLKKKETEERKLEMKKQHLAQKRQEMEKLQRECDDMAKKLTETAQQPAEATTTTEATEQPTEC